jgi:hypothetical protein
MPGINRSAGYTYVGAVGTLNGVSAAQVGQSVKLYLVTVKDVSDTAIDLRTEDDAVNEVFEAVIRTLPQGVLTYYAANADTGVISVICDGVDAPAASAVQAAIRNLGTTVGANSVDVSGTTVADGVSFTVA